MRINRIIGNAIDVGYKHYKAEFDSYKERHKNERGETPEDGLIRHIKTELQHRLRSADVDEDKDEKLLFIKIIKTRKNLTGKT